MYMYLRVQKSREGDYLATPLHGTGPVADYETSAQGLGGSQRSDLWQCQSRSVSGRNQEELQSAVHPGKRP